MNIDNLLTNKFLRFTIPGVILIVIWFLFKDNLSGLDGTIKRIQCRNQKEAIQENVSGVLVSKYLDADLKDVRTIKYLNGKDTLVSKLFFHEITDFYEYLQVGDSINKTSGKLDFIVTRNGNDTTYILNYGCKK
jgi:hypothetical protein